MHQLVKIFSSEDGETNDNPVWCLVDPANPAGQGTICGGEFFGPGESGAKYLTKIVQRRGITCKLCIKRIKAVKAIRL